MYVGLTESNEHSKIMKNWASAGKVMGTVFWDSEGCILVDSLKKSGKDQCSSLRSDTQQTSSCVS
jgi:hypothetical protein